MNKPNKSMKTKNPDRTVAFLDILGFKEILRKYSESTIGKVFYNAIKGAKKDIQDWVETFNNQYMPCHFSVFSDSIVIFSPDNSSEGVRSVVLHAQRIMQNLIVRQFPVRGAIAFGEIFLRKNPLIFVGKGYMKALELEKQQEWIGISVDKSVEENFPALFGKDNLISKTNLPDNKPIYFYSLPSIIRYRVPMKCGHEELLCTVNWLDKVSLLDENKKKLPDIAFVENIKKILPSSPKNLKKYTNTIDYIKYANSIIQVNDDGSERHLVHNDKFTSMLS